MLSSAGHSSAATILIIDDDVEGAAMLGAYLRREGFRVDACYDGEVGARAAMTATCDAVILDVMLPTMSGTEVLRRIREASDVPIIMLSAKGDGVDRVLGLELGADDYVPKPYLPRELVARLRAVLRRRSSRPPLSQPKELVFADLRVDTETRRVHCAGHELELTYSEFKLLTVLLLAGDRVIAKDGLSEQVLGRPLGPYDRSIDMHVSKLRQKLAHSRSSVGLETVRGVGYRIVAIR